MHGLRCGVLVFDVGTGMHLSMKLCDVMLQAANAMAAALQLPLTEDVSQLNCRESTVEGEGVTV